MSQPQEYLAEDPHHFGTINGVETEWTQIHRKLGNLAPKPERPPTPEAPTESELKEAIDSIRFRSLQDDELKDALEDTQDDDEARILEEIRQARLRELREKMVREKFGTVRELGGGDEYVKEVTEGSKKDDGIWVVCHLYAPEKRECKVLHNAMSTLAYENLQIKFVRIRYNLAIKDFPERLCPCLFIYYNGEMKKQIIGLKEFGGIDNVNNRSMGAYLGQLGLPIEKSKSARDLIDEENYYDIDDSDFEDSDFED